SDTMVRIFSRVVLSRSLTNSPQFAGVSAVQVFEPFAIRQGLLRELWPMIGSIQLLHICALVSIARKSFFIIGDGIMRTVIGYLPLAAALAVLTGAPATAQQPIKIGVLQPMTGPSTKNGVENYTAMQIARDMIN